MCVYIHIYIYILHIYIHIAIYIYMYYIYIYIHTYHARRLVQARGRQHRAETHGPSLAMVPVYAYIYIYICIYIYIYIHTYTHICICTANIRTEIRDFGGFDSSIFLNVRGGILMSIGNVQDNLSQQILAWRLLVGRLGVDYVRSSPSSSSAVRKSWQCAVLALRRRHPASADPRPARRTW